MNLWIVTIGSSDVQLIGNEVNKAKGRTEKQRSDRVWKGWYTEDIKEECYDISNPFDPKPLFQDQSYRVFPRVLGRVYQASDESRQQEIWDYLTFPLLDNFVQVLQDSPVLEAIVVLLTDQSIIFESERQRKPNSPYWQDTCELQPILQNYFANSFPGAVCDFILLTPNSEAESLDNWNAVLDLVRGKFRNLKIADQPVQVHPEEIVYVSHQAGTPAISSAAQFCSLAQFGDRVKFLVSNEYDPERTSFVESSSYLQGIKREQAKNLLKNYDYSGIDKLIGGYLSDDKKILLDAAIQWNFSNFAEGYNLIKSNKLTKRGDKGKSFVEILSRSLDFCDLVQNRTEDDKWWWVAYESAYLSFIRLKQGNTVESVFHSFRSVEGLLKIWAERKYPGELTKTKHPRHTENTRWDRNLRLYGEDLYTFIDMKRGINKDKEFDIWVFGNVVIQRRNDLFHNIKGLNDQENVFEAWRSSNETKWRDKPEEKWKNRVLNCLNFIIKEDFSEGFKSLEEASLMVKVHQELEQAIAQL